MTKLQLGNSPFDRVESKNGCSIFLQTKDLQTEPSYDSGISATVSAADSDRRKHASALSLFPKFNAFVRRTPTCWLWTAGKDAYGYGQITNGRGTRKTHRLAWIFAHGPIPQGAHVLHTCDVRHCVNPDHLFLGNQVINMKDAAAKGRLHVARQCTLSHDDVRAIRSTPYTRGINERLAEQFGVSPQNISLIRRGLRKQLVRA